MSQYLGKKYGDRNREDCEETGEETINVLQLAH